MSNNFKNKKKYSRNIFKKNKNTYDPNIEKMVKNKVKRDFVVEYIKSQDKKNKPVKKPTEAEREKILERINFRRSMWGIDEVGSGHAEFLFGELVPFDAPPLTEFEERELAGETVTFEDLEDMF